LKERKAGDSFRFMQLGNFGWKLVDKLLHCFEVFRNGLKLKALLKMMYLVTWM